MTAAAAEAAEATADIDVSIRVSLNKMLHVLSKGVGIANGGNTISTFRLMEK